MYEEQLKELGLTDNEARIYLLLLKQGMMNPSKISQKLGLHRGYVYDALDRMHEKEVISSILENNKKYFQATNLKSLIEILKLKLENFEKIVPELTKTINQKKEDTSIEVHKGKKVYRILLRDITATSKRNDVVYLIGVDEKLLEEVEPIYLEQYINTIKSKGIKEKIIIKKGLKKIKNKSLQYKEIDPEAIGRTAQIIYGTKVALFVLGIPYYLIIINNKEVAETYRKQFEILWKVAR